MSHRVVITDKCQHPAADVVLTDWTEDAVNAELWKSPVKIYADSVETIREFVSAIESFWDYYSEVWAWYVGDGGDWQQVGGEHMEREELLAALKGFSEVKPEDNSPNTIADYVERLQSGNRFGVARYGDGEWGAILGKIQRTSYGDEVTPELASAIKDTFLFPKPYFYASYGEPWSQEVREWINRHKVQCRWSKKAVLEQASRDGKLLPFLQALRERDVLVVGLERLKKMQSIIGCRNYVMPAMNCFGTKLRLPKAEVVLFACGLASVTFIHQLWDTTDATLIDIGSLFDPYCGVLSRRGHHREDFQANVKMTLEALNGTHVRQDGKAVSGIQAKAKEDASRI